VAFLFFEVLFAFGASQFLLKLLVSVEDLLSLVLLHPEVEEQSFSLGKMLSCTRNGYGFCSGQGGGGDEFVGEIGTL
jgi:hypothetical protein